MAAGTRAAESADAPLRGVRAVEVGPGAAGAFAGRWLAALGADVVKVEPPGGDPARRAGPFPDEAPDPEASGRFLWEGAGKRSAVLDLERAPDVERLAALLATADLLVDSLSPGTLAARGLTPERLTSLRPALVVVAVTPFGETGPWARRPATALTLAALSGMMWHVGPAGRPPLAQAGEQPEQLGGLHALAAALTGLYAAAQSGRGAHFDLSVQACGAAALGHYTSRTSQTGVEWGRSKPRALWRQYRARDGWVGVYAMPRNYRRLAEAMGIPELADAPPFLDYADREVHDRRIVPLLEGWCAKRTRAEVDELARRERVPLSVVRSIGELAASPGLTERDFFAEERHPRAGRLRQPGQLWRSGAHGWMRRPAPRLGEHTREVLEALPEPPAASAPAPPAAPPRAPLEGVCVLDLGQIWAGPYAATLLADQGAEVIKVESPAAWDPNRCVVPPPEGREGEFWNTSAFFHEYSRNKRCVSLDLRAPRARELLARLVARSDVVIENFRADVLDRLGIGYDWLRAQRPDVVLVSMAGFGKLGADRELPGYGPIIEQTSGLASLTGYGDGDPQLSAFAYGDPAAAVAAAAAAVAALIQRRRTGAGQHVDLAQRDVVTALLGEAFLDWSLRGREPEQRGNGGAHGAPHGVYPCRGEEEWLAIAVRTDEEWDGMRDAMERPAWADAPELADESGRRARRDALDARVAAWTARCDKWELFERCAAHGVPAGPVVKMRELLASPQLAARAFYETVSREPVGSWQTHGWVWRQPGAGPCVRRRAPDFAEHNDEVLRGLLGLSRAELDALERDRVIAPAPFDLPALRPARGARGGDA